MLVESWAEDSGVRPWKPSALADGAVTLVENNEVMKHAEKIYERNMDKHGFSFTPRGLYQAAFDDRGQLHKDWQIRVDFKKPEPSEYPELYNSRWSKVKKS